MFFAYSAKIVRVIDADTIVADLDLGFGIYARKKLRLQNIDAPEKNKKGGAAARKALEGLLIAVNNDVVVYTEKPGKYGRWLARVYAGATSVNNWLVEHGHAVKRASH